MLVENDNFTLAKYFIHSRHYDRRSHEVGANNKCSAHRVELGTEAVA